MKITELIRKKKQLLSFEFFPPKKVENDHILFETIDDLKGFSPDFVSITYGAGGSTKDKTISWTVKLQKDYKIETMMHLTCITSEENEIKLILDELYTNGVENILALRGDYPKDGVDYKISTEFKFASDLVRAINIDGRFCIGVAGYPEGHIEASDIYSDIDNLKRKLDAGGSFIITQLFFDNRYFYNYLELLHKKGINVPVFAGIMPITSFSQVERFKKMCGVDIPDNLINLLSDKSEDDTFKIGVDYAISQCEDLLKNNVSGLHFYTLNRSDATKIILNSLGHFNCE
ncbi:MAG: methylenetetrahydrofolate reductase [NAD(P)H] [Calditerrivibrio sp.]|nr:methylenetetrahydrofolate reductase [NAD(P)H] [Calditerrivibrio sp.]MCA1932781.1 methylenetetrahydrofolate reductase [NAD(P)H] [Calditerrivibrio sp.]MCA1980663.1 methylenetetrahydrofolate reductase [NAD(P)H] [Calditerrivibrio sp.]